MKIEEAIPIIKNHWELMFNTKMEITAIKYEDGSRKRFIYSTDYGPNTYYCEIKDSRLLNHRNTNF
jgi:hypothetical protein